MSDIKLEYVVAKPGEKAVVAKSDTGAMIAGEPIRFGFRTPKDEPVRQLHSGRLQITAPVTVEHENSVTYTATFHDLPRIMVSGEKPVSVSWGFGRAGGGNVVLAPDTEYSGEITASEDCAGCEMKLVTR